MLIKGRLDNKLIPLEFTVSKPYPGRIGLSLKRVQGVQFLIMNLLSLFKEDSVRTFPYTCSDLLGSEAVDILNVPG